MLQGRFFFFEMRNLSVSKIPFMSYLPGGVEQGGAGDSFIF